nr:sulfotransferase [Thiohalobacter sp. COW1]
MRSPILLTSMPRSGSTWCMKILAKSGNVCAMMEPDHLDVWGLGDKGMHPHVDVEMENRPYEQIYKAGFSGHTRRRMSPSRGYLAHVRREFTQYMQPARRVILKSVYSLANTEWIYKRFRPVVVVLLRNPYSVCHSIHRKWPDARLKPLASQGGLPSRLLGPHRELLEAAAKPYEILASRLGAYHKVALEAAGRHPEWVVVRHEDLCRDPLRAYEKLIGDIGLDWNESVAGYIRDTNKPKTSDEVQHVNRLSSDEIHKWKMLLSEQEIEDVRRFYRPFDMGFYSEIL